MKTLQETQSERHSKRNEKSLAPYRECRGRQLLAERNKGSGRGTFDRGDLKEAAGAAGRAMEPLACSWGFGTDDVDYYGPREPGKGALKAFEDAGASR